MEQKWRAVAGADFDPGADPCPVETSLEGPGDGTVPAWAARLIGTPLGQVYNLKQARKHGRLVEHPETLEVVARLMRRGELPNTVDAQDEESGAIRATRESMNGVIDDMVAEQIDRNDARVAEPQFWRRFVEEASLC